MADPRAQTTPRESGGASGRGPTRRLLASSSRAVSVIAALSAAVGLLAAAVVGSSWDATYVDPDAESVGPNVSPRPRLDAGFGPDEILLVLSLLAIVAVIAMLRWRRLAGPLALFTMAVAAAIVSAFVLLPDRLTGEGGIGAGASGSGDGRIVDRAQSPSVLLTFGFLVAALVLWLLFARRRGDDSEPEEPDQAEEIAQLATELGSTTGDARRRIVETYRELEARLSARGHPRARHETSSEYTSRVLEESGGAMSEVRELADLYESAAFGLVDADESHRRRAVDLLRVIASSIAVSAESMSVAP